MLFRLARRSVLQAPKRPAAPRASLASVGSSTSAFPLSANASGRFLQSADGAPFFIKGIAGWNIHTQISDSDQAFFLDDCVSKGVNAVMVMLLDHFYTAHVPTDFHGNAPFTSSGDFATPNAAYFTNFKRVLQMFLDRGMVMVLAPMYAGSEGTSPKQGWADEMRTNGSTKLRTFGQYVEGQFAAYPNIIYQHLGDNVADLADLAYAVAQGIGDVNPARLQSAHVNGGNSTQHATRDIFAPATYPLMNFNAVYTYPNNGAGYFMADTLLAQWSASPAIPVYKAEDHYLDDGIANAYWTRWQTYQAILSGACGNFTGINGVWYFDGHGNAGAPDTWQNQLNAAGWAHARRAWTLLTGYAWQASTPDTGNTFLTGGVSTGNSRAVARLANDGTWAMAYVPANRQITFDMSKFSKTVTASWIDPTNGAKTAIGSHANSGSQAYTPSGNNAAGDGDWVIVFE